MAPGHRVFGKPVAAPGTSTDLRDVQVWIALDDVDEQNGCMCFVPRPHRFPSLRHAVVSGDPDDEGRLLAIDEPFDSSGAVACPVRAGGCTLHLVGTPHFTGPNLSHRSRRAYIVNIGPAGFAGVAEAALEAEWGASARL